MRWVSIGFLSGILACAGFPATVEPVAFHDDSGVRFRCQDPAQSRVCLDVLQPSCALEVVSERRKVGEHGTEISLPPESDDRLEVSCDGRTWIVRSAMDLIGYVDIQSPADAVEYLRFFSSMSTVHLFNSQAMEIYVGGVGECFSSCLSEDRWRALGLEPTAVEVTSQGYLVSRNLVRPIPSDTDVTAFRVTERVSPDGSIEVLAEEEIPIGLLDKARLTFPGYL